jgi:valyl-tRNA synthetase
VAPGWEEEGDHVLEIVSSALRQIRKAKSEAKLSMRTEISRVVVTGDTHTLALFRSAISDIAAAGTIGEVLEEERVSRPFEVSVQVVL